MDVDAFWEKVDRRGPDECWPWLGTHATNGYGRAWIDHRRRAPAHRIAYELVRDPIPAGLSLDHLCRNRDCVNPAHLEPVTNRENVLRGVGHTAVNAAKTACKRGHPFDEANTYRAKGHRYCRTCMTARLHVRHVARSLLRKQLREAR
jgi:hypothetical protein